MQKTGKETKMPEADLDRIDRHLLAILQENGRDA